MLYPKAVVEKPVDDGVNEAVGHGQPVSGGEDCSHDATGLGLIFTAQMRNKVQSDIEDV